MHTNRHQEAKLLLLDTFLSCKNARKCVCGQSSAPDPAGGAYSALPGPLAGNGEGPGKGEVKGEEGRGGEGVGRGGWPVGSEGEGLSPNENPGYGLGRSLRNEEVCGIDSLVDMNKSKDATTTTDLRSLSD